MDSVLLCWGKNEYRLERSEISSLSVLKEEVSVVLCKCKLTNQKLTGIELKCIEVFFESRAIRSEAELADAIESSNPVLYIHSKQSIQIYVKLGWLLKSLNVYVFYSVGYLSYLSLDV